MSGDPAASAHRPHAVSRLRESDRAERMNVMGARALVSGVFAVVITLLFAEACSSEEVGAGPGEVKGGPGCANGVKDGDEINVDCGGACGKCAGDPCAGVDECKSGECKSGLCTAPIGNPAVPGPTNGVKDNGETDVDCGGANAPACAAGKACAGSDDCADEYCPEAAPRVCVTPKSDDGVMNGTETDIDCGGAAPTNAPKCAVGKKCVADTDCTGACNYKKVCVEAPSCKPQFGGDTCGTGDFEDAGRQHESCCKSLLVPGYNDPGYAGKQVYLDKYEVTAGRVRAFIEDIAAKNGGQPNIKAWLAANKPKYWSSTFDFILPSGDEAEAGVTMPHASLANGVAGTANVGFFYSFNATRYVYVHGENCFHGNGSYGFSTFFYPANVMALTQSSARGVPRSDEAPFAPLAVGAKEQLDMKSMNCIPAAVLAAFCHWDGGQLATDEVLDFVTGADASLGFKSGCGPRCAPLAQVQASSDSGNDNTIIYRYPLYNETSEGTFRVAAPGRVTGDVVRINQGDEPWMDVRGNMHEIVLNMTGATFTNEFGIKYQGIGYSSARAISNNTAMKYPEYKAAYSGGRCMRFK